MDAWGDARNLPGCLGLPRGLGPGTSSPGEATLRLHRTPWLALRIRSGATRSGAGVSVMDPQNNTRRKHAKEEDRLTSAESKA
jgi:hypothetical protein